MTSTAEILAAIAAVDRDQLPALMLAIAARMADEGSTRAPRAQASDSDELLDIAETAKRLGKSKSWLYHNHRHLPFSVRGIGTAPRFSRRGLEKYIAKHAL